MVVSNGGHALTLVDNADIKNRETVAPPTLSLEASFETQLVDLHEGRKTIFHF